MKLLFEKIKSIIDRNYYDSNFSADALLKNIDYEKELVRKTVKKKDGKNNFKLYSLLQTC